MALNTGRAIKKFFLLRDRRKHAKNLSPIHKNKGSVIGTFDYRKELKNLKMPVLIMADDMTGLPFR